MIFKIVDVPTTPTNVYTLLDGPEKRSQFGIALQAPSTNAAVVNFGSKGAQPGFIPAGSSSEVMPIHSLKDLYLVGTSGDSVILMVF